MKSPADRIAEAPRAWAWKRNGRVDPGYVSTDVDRLRVHLEEFCADDEIEVIPVALVELKEGE